MKRLSFLLLVFFSINLVGCIKILNDDLISKETKLVLNAAISPDSAITINLSHTSNVFESETNENLPFVDSALVSLYENNQHLFDLESLGYGYYIKSDFYPEVGNEYRVEANYGQFKKIEANTSIPNIVPIKSFDTVIEVYEDEYYGKGMQYIGKIKYKDPSGISNYYQLSCRIWYNEENGDEVWYEHELWVPESEYFLFDHNYNKLLWSDKYSDGQEVEISFVFLSNYRYNNKKLNESETLRFTFYLQTINFDYYTYLKSYNLYRETGGGEDPFSEPVVIYSNIDNGYGIFGAYDFDTVSTEVEINFDEKGGQR